MFPLIHRYHIGSEIPKHSFFMLAVGPDAGKPVTMAGPDMYIVKCPHELYYNFFLWLASRLHEKKMFKINRRVSIPLIDKEEIRIVFRKFAHNAFPIWEWHQQVSNAANNTAIKNK